MRDITLVVPAIILLAVIIFFEQQDDNEKLITDASVQCMNKAEFAENYKNYTLANSNKNTVYYRNMLDTCEVLKAYETERQERQAENSKKIETLTSHMLSLLGMIITIVAIPIVLYKSGFVDWLFKRKNVGE